MMRRPGAREPPMPDAASEQPLLADPADGRTTRRKRRRLRALLLIGVPLLVVLAAGYLYLTGGRYVTTENAYVRADMVAVSAQVSGPISDVVAAENQSVKAGDILFRIDPAPFRVARAKAAAELEKARHDVRALKSGYRHKQQELALARIKLAYARNEYERQADLVTKKIVSGVRHDAAKNELNIAQQNIAVLEQDLATIAANLGGDPAVAVDRHAAVLAAKAALEQAELDLAHTVVRAPFDGIASKTPDRGQYVKAGTPVMSVVADKHVWIEANLKETELTHIRPGQPATIEVDAYPGRRWKARVASISQGTGAVFAVLPPQNASGNWVKVVQRVPVRLAIDRRQDAPMLRAGMSVHVEIDTGHRRPMPGFVRAVLRWLGHDAGTGARADLRP